MEAIWEPLEKRLGREPMIDYNGDRVGAAGRVGGSEAAWGSCTWDG